MKWLFKEVKWGNYGNYGSSLNTKSIVTCKTVRQFNVPVSEEDEG